jgi:hypothetical protein
MASPVFRKAIVRVKIRLNQTIFVYFSTVSSLYIKYEKPEFLKYALYTIDASIIESG